MIILTITIIFNLNPLFSSAPNTVLLQAGLSSPHLLRFSFSRFLSTPKPTWTV